LKNEHFTKIKCKNNENIPFPKKEEYFFNFKIIFIAVSIINVTFAKILK